ncbi:MAG: putative cobaltochelatase [Desulfobacteraceae bacterium]|jgi:magnesium chelatase subunit D
MIKNIVKFKKADVFPFSAIVGQEQLKLALILNAINPAVGGVLIRGEKGTAKSTAVRALAALLPEINVVKGCPYACDPDQPQHLCDQCRDNAGRVQTGQRRIGVVTLPLNATEDRVAGGIDFNLAVKKGVRVLQPGLLAKAHRGILYVDEVNLLDDHIVDIILDAAASGRNVVEREGISFTHASLFILVGTMNPEEGELRPQLLDRFGLCVDVASEKDVEKRIVLMQQREAYDADPRRFIQQFETGNEKNAAQIISARKFLKNVKLAGHLRTLICELCTENNVAGHRADLVIEQAARAMAALRQHSEVTVEDIKEVALLALSHRKREAAPPPPPPSPPEHDHEDPPESNEEETQENEERQQEEPQEGQSAPPEEMSPSDGQEDAHADNQDKEDNRGDNAIEQIFDVGETFKVKKIASPKDRVFRRGSGRRSRTRVSQKQGRYVKSVAGRNTSDVALDASLRAAAPYQLRRKNGNGLAVVLQQEDIRGKIREKRIGNFLLFAVDASGSMGARGRMVASKGAIMSLLLDAYQKRDRVAMVSFRKDEAVVNLPPTSSIELAANLLKEMPVGGRTPLSAGLASSYEVLRNYLLREPAARPIAIIITDGKSNMAMGEKKPLDEAYAFAERLAMDERIRFIVVDTEDNGLVTFGLAQKLASAMNAQYFKIEDLKADTLLNIVKGEV